MKQIKRKVYIPIIVIIAIIGLFPVVESSILGFVGGDLIFLLPATYFYLIVTTEAEIFSIIYLAKTKYWKNKNSNNKNGFKHKFVHWGMAGILIFSSLPLMGAVAIVIFTATYRQSSKKEKLAGRVLLYFGYIIRIILLTTVFKTIMPG